MILGRNRVPYAGPSQASPNFRPGMPHTGFYSQFDPFGQVMRRTKSYGPFHPHAQPMPIGPAPSIPAPPPTPVTPGAAASPIGPSGVSGFGFGSTGGTKMHHHAASSYRTMRQGMIPGIHPNGSNIRSGVHNVHSIIHHSMPFQTRALPPPPPPPPMVVAPGGTKGLFGTLFGAAGPHRARKHRWWHLTPPSTEEQVVAAQTGCETYPPRADGIKVTVCNGRVTKYEDANGNVNTPDPNSGSEFGHAHHHRHHHHPAAAPVAGFGFPGFPGRGGFRREGFRPGGFNPGFNPAAAAPGGFPGHHRHHHHPWQPQQQYLPPNPNPPPAFGRW